MLRSLPYCSDGLRSDRKIGEWYYDFLEACLTHGDTSPLPRFIDPEFQADLMNFRAAREAEIKKQLVIDTDIVEDDKEPDECRPQSPDYDEFRKLAGEI